MSISFSSLSLCEETRLALEDMGFSEATPIQEASIEKLLHGYDLIGQAQTGTGKTLAFAIPAIEQVDPDEKLPQALVLCPTRELCVQVSEEFRRLLKYHEGIRVLAVYGGVPIDRQIKAVKGVQILVATPGRFIDLMRRHCLKLDMVQMAVLDEADEMLNMGFRPDIELILAQLPTPRQTVLFSATMPDEIVALADTYLEDPIRIDLTPENQRSLDEVSEFYCALKARLKPEALRRLMLMHPGARTLVFCNTKKQVDELASELSAMGVNALMLHGDLKQAERDLMLKRFKTGETSLLIATDIAARGLDIADVEVVVNFDLPAEEETYLHRIGRTARAGKHGTAYSFVVGHELETMAKISEFTGKKITPMKLPSLSELEDLEREARLSRVKAIADAGATKKYRKIWEDLLAEGFEPDALGPALLSEMFYKNTTAADDEADALSREPKRISAGADAEMVKLHVNAGRAEGLRVKDLVGAFAGECGISGRELGEITLLEHFSYVEVPLAYVQDVLKIMNGCQIKGRKIKVAPAEKGI